MNSDTHSLKTDLYELTMAAGYFQNKVDATATFELFCHNVPAKRPFLIACGLQQVVDYVLNLKFLSEDISFLKEQPAFSGVDSAFFKYLKDFKFTGDVWAIPEGEIFFAREPVIQVTAPVIEAQIVETYLLSMINIQSLVATKAARVVTAASGDGTKRSVVDFGSRRAHGPQAGVLAARASFIGGCMGTSNVYAGREFGIPIFGTMAHSWVETFDSEEESFEKYHAVFPKGTILLIDTYDTIKALHKAIELKKSFKAVRIDSGDIARLSKEVRTILDGAKLRDVKIIASGNLNEYKIKDLVAAGAPVDMFGVGTDMATSRDLPALDLTYKLVQLESKTKGIKFKSKKSEGKATIPGRKQIFRGEGFKDTLGVFTQKPPAGTQPLLEAIIEKGKLKQKLPGIMDIQKRAQKNLSALDPALLDFDNTDHAVPQYSPELKELEAHHLK